METKIFTLLFCLILPFQGLSQPSEIDSLERILDTDIHDIVKVDVLKDLYEYYIDKDLEKSLAIANQWVATAESINAHQDMCRSCVCTAYSSLGKVHRLMNSHMDTVLYHFEKALSCCETNKDSVCKEHVLIHIGTVYQRTGFYVKAISSYQEALDLSESRGDTLTMIRSLANIGLVLKARSEHETSLQYSRQALHYAKAIDHTRYISMITNNMAVVYFRLGVTDTALVLYEEALAIKREIGSELSLVTTLANIGQSHIKEKRYEQAAVYLDEAYEISQRLNYPYGLGLCLMIMAESKVHQKQYQEAIQLAEEGLGIIGQQGDLLHIGDLQLVLSTAYEQLGRYELALTHHKAYHTITDSIFHSKKEQQIQQLTISYQTQQKEIENKLLKSEQAIIQQELQKSTHLSIGLIIALFLACGWAFAVYRNNQARKRMNSLLEAQVAERTKNLQIANKQLKQANYELQTFNHIASHDIKEPMRNVGNYVSLIFRRLPQEIKDQMQDYYDIINRSIKQLYTLVEDFASYSKLSREELATDKEVNLAAIVGSIEVGLQSFIQSRNGKVIYKDLPIIWTNASLMFVALKNLVQNGLKFNQSPTPTVEIVYQSTSTHHQIIVSDNGIGIDPKYHQQIFKLSKQLHSKAQYSGSGIGLALVQLVVEKLEGSVSVKSNYGEGSTFILEFPK